MKERIFRFKQFQVRHEISSMPVGIDGVLIAAWTKAGLPDFNSITNILDIGTGCGLIALICAQFFTHANIEAVDIDDDSISEATRNFNASPWSDRIKAIHSSLQQFSLDTPSAKFDLIISNPPYFMAGLKNPDTTRLRARHESSLPLSDLAAESFKLLKPSGKLAVILPYGEVENQFMQYAFSVGFNFMKRTVVKGHTNKAPKRSLLLCVKGKNAKIDEDILILESSPGIPTTHYRQLCHELYLKF
ncbi:MAG: methyltransferase [Prevotella sp.]|nr:methyltransferase [Bacteroides sp.]MCM1365627.1 methyltransferase [Prevotella sp.]